MIDELELIVRIECVKFYSKRLQQMNRKRTNLLLVLCATFAYVPTSFAYDFSPTDIEWQSWPGYCKAKYVWTSIGRQSRFSNLVTPEQRSELAQWENAGIRGLHHHCAGTAWLQRAKLERTETRRNALLRQAESESTFSFERSNRRAPQFSFLAIQMAAIMNEQGKTAEALGLLDLMIIC